MVHVDTKAVELSLESLSWASDSTVFQNANWFNESLTFDECFSDEEYFTPPSQCITGRPRKFQYLYDQDAVAASPYYARRLFENGIEDPHFATWMRASGLGPIWKHFGVLKGGLNSLPGGTDRLRDYVPETQNVSACTCNGVQNGDKNGFCVTQPLGITSVPDGTKMLEVALLSTFNTAQFNGTKSLILTSTSTLGNLQESIAIPCIVAGCLCWLASFVWYLLRCPGTSQEKPEEHKCGFAALVWKRLSAKQKRTMNFGSPTDLQAAITLST
jgi:hypothetical protein